MNSTAKRTVGLFIDRATRQWVVRDLDGNFWEVPAGDAGWERRQPYEMHEDRDIEAVPGHYRYMLDLPF